MRGTVVATPVPVRIITASSVLFYSFIPFLTAATSASLPSHIGLHPGLPVNLPTLPTFPLSTPDNWIVEALPHFVSCDIAYRSCGLYRFCGRILPVPGYRGSGSRTPGSADLSRYTGLFIPLLGFSAEVAGQNRALHYILVSRPRRKGPVTLPVCLEQTRIREHTSLSRIIIEHDDISIRGIQ